MFKDIISTERAMPYTPAHKAATRARIVSCARRLFNRYGFEQVTIDQVMGEAGLTRGGFYHHFRSKDQLYAEAVASFRQCNPARPKMEAMAPQGALALARTLVDLYLSDEMLDDVEYHCPLYALPGDVARAGRAPQSAYTDLIRSMGDVYRRALAGQADADRRAEAIVALCVGGMVLARTTADAGLRQSLRQSARAEALALLAPRP
jgi:AcrR family transcriptional regulator